MINNVNVKFMLPHLSTYEHICAAILDSSQAQITVLIAVLFYGPVDTVPGDGGGEWFRYD